MAGLFISILCVIAILFLSAALIYFCVIKFLIIFKGYCKKDFEKVNDNFSSWIKGNIYKNIYVKDDKQE